MKRMSVPVENVAEIVWGALLVGYLLFDANPALRQPTVLVVFLLSGSAALFELYLRRIKWAYLVAYDTIVWSLLLSAMVAVTGGRGSEVWPAYLLMSLTAPAVDGRRYAYILMGLNAALYALLYLFWNPWSVPLQPALLCMRIGLYFLVTWVVDRSMLREREANAARVALIAERVGELTQARDAERRRIATEIHDWLGSGLIAPMRKLELAQRAPSPEEANARVTEALQSLGRSHGELRRVMENLHPHLLEQMGVEGALQAYLMQWGEENQIAVRFTSSGEAEPPEAIGLTLFRILQEALNNVAKHAAASQVEVALQQTADELRLEIWDNGQGFVAKTRGGRGLTGMRERLSVYAGRLQVDSASGAGTKIQATLPLKPLQ